VHTDVERFGLTFGLRVVIGTAGGRAVVRVSWDQLRCPNAHVCHFLYFKYVVPTGPMSTSFGLMSSW